jgi:putative flippase GtrA
LKIDYGRAPRFLGLGGVSFATNVGLTVVLKEWVGLIPEVALAISIVVVFTINFLACRYFVFDARLQDFRQQLFRFALASGGFRGAEYLAFVVCHRFFGVQYVVALVGILVVSMMVKFVFYQRVVFTSDAAAGGRAGEPRGPAGWGAGQ